jgi:hypothetical protein
MASTKHQVAVIRYHSSWIQTWGTQEAIAELTSVANAFHDCGDGYMQVLTRKGIAKVENSKTSQEKAKQLRAIRLGSVHLHEWLLTFTLVLMELEAIAKERFIDYEQVTAAVELLRVGEAAEARRLGPKYHNSSGSLSRIFDMLNVFTEAEASFAPVNRMIFAQYTHDLMRRYPPEFYKATRLADNMLKTLTALSNSWKVDLESKDCKRVAEKAEELVKCWEAEKDWGKASHTALIYEEWMVDAGKSEHFESNARPLLEAAERSATAYFNRSVQKYSSSSRATFQIMALSIPLIIFLFSYSFSSVPSRHVVVTGIACQCRPFFGTMYSSSILASASSLSALVRSALPTGILGTQFTAAT